MEIIIVRHGLSEANKAGLVSGRLDTPLTPEGHEQARRLAERLADKDIDAIFSSPLKRAMETALPLAEKLGVEINVDRRLIELNWGSFEAKSDKELTAQIGMSPREYLDTYDYDFTKYGGESSKQVESRVKDSLDELALRPYDKVLLVCHGGIVRMLHYLITGEKITWQPNGEELYLNDKSNPKTQAKKTH